MKEKVFKACLKVIEREGFKNFTFSKASQESGIPINVFHRHFETPVDIMIYLFKNVDDQVLKTFKLTEGLSNKDQLFEILMIRFEASEPYKPILQRFWKEWAFSPNEYPPLLCQGLGSMSWMLDTAGLKPRGITGLIRAQGLLGIYLFALRTWLSDDSPDLSKTMASLDKGLSNVESAAKVLDSLSEITFSS